MLKETTLDDVLEIVTFIKDNAVTKVEFEELKQDVNGLKQDVNGLKQDVNGLKQDVNHIKNVMVTKDYLDNKLFDLRGDFVLITRKEDTKLKTLIEILLARHVLDNDDAERILKLEPFHSLSV